MKIIRRPDKKAIGDILVTFLSIVLTLAALEAGVRIYNREFRFEAFLPAQRSLVRAAYPSQFDSVLGWIPRPGFSGSRNVWNTMVTILDNGIRSNGPEAMGKSSPALPPVLAVGDSFTFGDAVSDQETWPAVLERKLKRRVINGGVFGYGLDQSIMRARRLVDLYKPDTVILSIYSNDIYRCCLSDRAGVRKPYFDIEKGGRLILKNVPVSYSNVPSFDVRLVLSYSALIHHFMSAAFPRYWIPSKQKNGEAYPRKKVVQVCCLLMSQFVNELRDKGVKEIFVLFQYPQYPDPAELFEVDALMPCVKKLPVHIVDLKGPMDEVKHGNPRNLDPFFHGHMTLAGNTFVAQEIEKAFRKEGLFAGEAAVHAAG